MSLAKPEHRKTKCMITCLGEPLNVQITELENRRWVARHQRLGEVYQRLQTFSWKLNKLWGSHVQHEDVECAN